jgi:hypothetical protein
MKLILIIVFLLSTAIFGQAQEVDSLDEEGPEVKYDTSARLDPLPINQNQLEKYAGDPHFVYTEKDPQDSWWFRFRAWLSGLWSQFWTWLFGDYNSNAFLVFLFKSLPYIILGCILLFVIWLFYKINPGSKLLLSKETPDVFYTDDEEIIKTKDIRELIDRALSNKDYRLAVRYYFLLILQNLNEAEIIDYAFDKTNSDYIREIKSDTILMPFKKVSMLYEYTWYGNFTVTEQDYTKASNQLGKLHSKIKKERE